jgi:hypothetical protein
VAFYNGGGYLSGTTGANKDSTCRDNMLNTFSRLLLFERRERLIEVSAWKVCPANLLRLTRPKMQGDTHSQEIPQLSDAHYHPLWLHVGRRYIRHEVEASTPVLRKLGTREGLGSQWCNRLPR